MGLERYNLTWSGVFTAIVTPFKDGEIDFVALEKLLDLQITSGVSGVVVAGSTGEAAALNEDEFRILLDFCCGVVRQRIKIIAATGTNNTDITIGRTMIARDIGADAALVVAPYYNKPSQFGMVKHFEKIANTVAGLPLLLYNVPGRTIADIGVEALRDLVVIGNIVGIKEATGNIEKLQSLIESVTTVRSDFAFLSGDDATAVAFNVSGGCGIIAVLSNIVPQDVVKIYNYCKLGEYESAGILQQQYFSLISALFCQSNPVPVKYLLSKMGLIVNDLRLPLMSLESQFFNKMDEVLTKYNLIKK